MDDLNDEPQKVAEDIIEQGTQGLKFRQAAIDRIVMILESYHQLQKEIAEPKQQKQTENDIRYEGEFAWIIEDDQKKGPFCAYCHIKDKDLKLLIDRKNGEWQCPECERYIYDDSYKIQTRARRAPPRF